MLLSLNSYLSTCGSWGNVMECKSTMLKIQFFPSFCKEDHCLIAPKQLPKCGTPVGWIPEKIVCLCFVCTCLRKRRCYKNIYGDQASFQTKKWGFAQMVQEYLPDATHSISRIDQLSGRENKPTLYAQVSGFDPRVSQQIFRMG